MDISKCCGLGPIDAAGHHPFGARRRRRSRGRTAPGGRRLRGQAVQRQGTAGPGRGRAAPFARAAARLQGDSLPGIADLARPSSVLPTAARTELSEKEVDLLRYLASISGRAISRDEIAGAVWQISPRGSRHARSTCT